MGFKFPDSLLHQVNECSNGGFILFNFDDQKNPQIYTNFDDSMSALALQNYVDICSKTFQNVNYQIAISEALPNSGEDEQSS